MKKIFITLLIFCSPLLAQVASMDIPKSSADPSCSSGQSFLWYNTSTSITKKCDNGTVSSIATAGALQHVRLTKTAAQTFSNNTAAAITFDSEVEDVSGLHSTSVNTDRVTFTTAGIYLFSLTEEWTGSSAGLRQVYCVAGGSTSQTLANDVRFSASSATMPATISGSYRFAVSDYITCNGFQTSGGNLNMTSANTYLTVTYLGP